MNHPKREEWVPYVFGETKPETRRELAAHLRGCAECRQEVENWQRSLGRLNAWKLPRVPKPVRNYAPGLSWAAAAAVLLLLVGFGVGRLSAGKTDLQKVRAAIEPEMRQEFAKLLHDEITRSATATLAASSQQTEQAVSVLGKAFEDGRAQDNRAILAALERIELQNASRFVSLKRDLDTVAVNTEHELVQLADSK